MLNNFFHRNKFVAIFPGQASMYDKYAHKKLGNVQVCYGTQENPKIHLMINFKSFYFAYPWELIEFLFNQLKYDSTGNQSSHS